VVYDMEELLDQLNPDRDYGSRTYGEVVTGIRDGNINVAPGHPVPMLRVSGISIKGTGAPLALVEAGKETNHKRPWMAEFEERGTTDFDAVYEALVKSALGGDSKAQMYFLDRMLGKPRDSSPASGADWTAIIGALAVERMVESREPVVSAITVIDSLE
jgi:hypothetical protein